MSVVKPETLFRKRIVKWIKDNLIHTEIFSIQQLSLCGDPDLILCVNGKFVALEIKREGGVATPLQLHRLKSVREKAKGFAFVVDPGAWPKVQETLLKIDKDTS